MKYEWRRARSKGFPGTKTIRPPKIRSRKQPRNREPGTRRKKKTRQWTRRRRRKKTRVMATQGTTTTTTIHHQRPRKDRSPGLPPRSNRFPDLSGKPIGTNPGLGVGPGNGPGVPEAVNRDREQ